MDSEDFYSTLNFYNKGVTIILSDFEEYNTYTCEELCKYFASVWRLKDFTITINELAKSVTFDFDLTTSSSSDPIDRDFILNRDTDQQRRSLIDLLENGVYTSSSTINEIEGKYEIRPNMDHEYPKCKFCDSEYLLTFGGKVSDQFYYDLPSKSTVYSGYVPEEVGLGGGDYLELTVCLNCNKLQTEITL